MARKITTSARRELVRARTVSRRHTRREGALANIGLGEPDDRSKRALRNRNA